MRGPLAPSGIDRLAVVSGDRYDPRNRKRTPTLLVEASNLAVQQVWEYVTDWEHDAPLDMALMEPVMVSLVFLRGRDQVALVGLKGGSACSDLWDNWDRRLRTSTVFEWLNARDIDPRQRS